MTIRLVLPTLPFAGALVAAGAISPTDATAAAQYQNATSVDRMIERAFADVFGRRTMTEAKAREVVARAYQSVLGRDPDPAADVYVQKVWREKWTERDVANELRKSDEFRNKR